MSWLDGTDHIIGAMAAGVSRPIARPVVRPQTAAARPQLTVLHAPVSPIVSHVESLIPKLSNVALTPTIKSPSGASAAAAAGTASLTPIKSTTPPSKAATAATQAATPAPSPQSLSHASSSANSLMAAAHRVAAKHPHSGLGAKAQTAATNSLARVAHAQAAAAHRVMGDVLGVDWGTVTKTALDPSAWLATQAGTDDAFTAMVEAGGRALDVISQLPPSASSVADQGNTIVANMESLLATANATLDPSGSAYAGGAGTQYGSQAFALTQQENTWENTAAPLASMTPGTDQPGSGGGSGGGSTGGGTVGTVPTITSISDQTSGYPTGGFPGDTVLINGTHFTGATAVDFGGTPVPYAVNSDSQITATLPANFQTGNVHVKTPAGTATSSGAFANLQGAPPPPAPPPYGGGGGGGGSFDTGGGGGGGFGDAGGGDATDDMSPDPGIDESQVDWGDGSQPSDEDQISQRGRGFTPMSMQFPVMPAAPTQESEVPSSPTTPVPPAPPVKKTIAERYSDGTDIVIEILGDNPGADVTYNDHDTVAAVQAALNKLGFGAGAVDGIFGPKTQKAVRAMQKTAGIPETGVIDYGVLMALKVPAPSTSSTSSRDGERRGSSGGYAQQIATQPAAAAPAASPTSRWASPAWDGAPFKLWQGVVGAVGLIGIGFGVVAAVRR